MAPAVGPAAEQLVDAPRGRPPDRPGRAAGPPPRSRRARSASGEPGGDLLQRQPERRPPVRQLHRSAQRPTAAAADPERHVLVEGVRLHDQVVEVVVRAVVGDLPPARARPAAPAARRRLARRGRRTGRRAARTRAPTCRRRDRARAAHPRSDRACRSAWPAPAGGGSRGPGRRWRAGSGRCGRRCSPSVASGSQYTAPRTSASAGGTAMCSLHVMWSNPRRSAVVATAAARRSRRSPPTSRASRAAAWRSAG